jgi:hypothetical protein
VTNPQQTLAVAMWAYRHQHQPQQQKGTNMNTHPSATANPPNPNQMAAAARDFLARHDGQRTAGQAHYHSSAQREALAHAAMAMHRMEQQPSAEQVPPAATAPAPMPALLTQADAQTRWGSLNRHFGINLPNTPNACPPGQTSTGRQAPTPPNAVGRPAASYGAMLMQRIAASQGGVPPASASAGW